MSYVFVTVGTTKFDELINAVLSEESLDAFKCLDVKEVRIQIGHGRFTEETMQRVFGVDDISDEGFITYESFKIAYYRFKDSLLDDLRGAKVVIGHAGAGTVLECMRIRVPLVVIINERLMDNHQSELATKLGSNNHLLFGKPSQIAALLTDDQLFRLTPFDAPNQAKLAVMIDTRMGLVKQS